MNRSKWWIIVVVVLLLINTVVLGMLWLKKKPQGPPPGGNAKAFLVKELNLTTEQQQKYDALQQAHQEKVRGIMNGMKDLKDALFENISQPATDSAIVDSLARRISDKERERDIATFYHFREFRAMLNAEQQKKFDAVLKDVLRMIAGPKGPPPERERGEGPPGDMPPPPGEDSMRH